MRIGYEDGDTSGAGQECADSGAELLVRFAMWCGNSAHLSDADVGTHYQNASVLVDYLCDGFSEGPAEAGEYELRRFVDNVYIRTCSDVSIGAVLPDTLALLYGFLTVESGFQWPEWLEEILAERERYTMRLHQYLHILAAARDPERADIRNWLTDYRDDMDSRCLLLPTEFADGASWGETMGMRESALYDEANARWQRDRLRMLQESADMDDIRSELTARYLQWMHMPQDELDGQTPSAVILAEQDENGAEMRQAEPSGDDEA
ncbi:MAG: hypothetical protein KGJ62_05145 [Armatimonadetes bacterium]|nr:hypothetical protein [Armatimonadota bacterium]MDE2205448.1 hypothetical protein [Armatimonadota bacterium]